MGEPLRPACMCSQRRHPHVCPLQAAANLQKMKKERLEQFGEVLAIENPDLYKWMTGQSPVPDEVRATASSGLVPWLIGILPDPPQIENDVLRELVADLEAERAPKVTAASSVGFEGKVWE